MSRTHSVCKRFRQYPPQALPPAIPAPRPPALPGPPPIHVLVDHARSTPHAPQPRTLPLPVSRHNDVRAQRFLAQHQANTAHLGPGCYSPPNSTGGAKRRTYRIYVDPFAQPRPSGLGAGSEPRSGSSSPASSAFAGTFRAHKAGPFNSRTDSSLVARR